MYKIKFDNPRVEDITISADNYSFSGEFVNFYELGKGRLIKRNIKVASYRTEQVVNIQKIQYNNYVVTKTDVLWSP